MKKVWKRTLSYILVIIMAVGATPIGALVQGLTISANAAYFSGTCGANISWYADSYNMTVTVSGTGPILVEQVSPQYALSYRNYVGAIILNEGITMIGSGIFSGCTSMSYIMIPETTTSIGSSAFSGCSSLKDVYYSGSQEQWKNISIGSYNSSLTNATIHYAKVSYSQTHTVDDYQSAYAEYKKVYFNSAGTPLDGSNGNPDFCIPGLSSSENLVPQGLGYDADANVVYITSYKSSGDSNSVLFALDGTTGEMIGEYNLCYQNGSAVKSHVGGVAVYNHTIYIASGDSILTYSTSSLGGESVSANGKYKISGMLNNANCSYVTINDGILWTGNFYDEDEDYNQPAGTTEKYNNSVVLGFDLTKANILDSYDYKFNIDNKIENIQSAYYADGTLYLVTSYGRENDSVVYYVSAKKASGINVAASVLKYFRGLPMMENGFVKDGCLYSIFESAAWKYHGADSKVSRDPSDVVWKIDLGQMKNNACTLKRDTPSFNHDSSAFTLPDNDTYFIENRLYEILKKDAHLLDYAGLIVAKNSKWGGSCYGIASTVALSKNGMLGFNDMTTEQGIASYYDLPKPCDDNRLLSVINYYHLMQKTKNGGEKAIISKNYEWSNGLISLFKDKKHNKATLKEIVNRANEKDLYVLSFSHYMKGHAYVLVDCVKVDGKYKVKLFDCNMIIDFVYMTIESDFSSFTLSTGDYKYGDALKLVDPKLMLDLDGESFTNGSSTQSFKKSAAADDHKRFSVVPERPFTLTNAEGKTLVFDGEDFSGDMAVYDFNIVFNDTACEYEFEIDDSSKFTLDCDSKIDCSIGNNSSYFYAEGENISSVTFSEDTMKMDGENITFKAFASTDELVGEKEPGLVSVSANSTGSVTLTKSENSVEVSAEGKLSDVEASSYIGTEKETQTIEGDTESLTINSSGEEVIEKKEVHSVAINDITIDYKSSATITPQITADVGASYTVTYTSSNPSVATVDNSGNIFGAGVGSATITVTVTDSYNNVVTDSRTVTVNAPPSVKSVSIGDITVGYKSSAVITPKIEKDEGADYEVTFTSSNSSAVSVDQSGRVTSNKTFGFAPASATITCTVTDKNSGNTVSDSCTVTVQFTPIQWIIKIVLFGWLWY
ncbi:MAG: leucine-rich repeat protein [Clostridia bacterium]|nr:leucine-rich repeat protein [Clostridia bacterium]